MRDLALRVIDRLFPPPKPKSPIITNVLRAESPRRALVCFISRPFQVGLDHSHTVGHECQQIVTTLGRIGYEVDVVDFDQSIISHLGAPYDLVVGFGTSFEEALLRQFETCPLFISYNNGSMNEYSNVQGLLRMKEVAARRGRMALGSIRYQPTTRRLSSMLCHHTIVFGNEVTARTFEPIVPRESITIVPGFFHARPRVCPTRDWTRTSRSFLWFGSAGAIHKGLDLLLEVFLVSPELELHICGLGTEESVFRSMYSMALEQAPNIHEHGFLEIDGPDFLRVTEGCGFAILPSVSEGCAVSLLTAVGNGGCIPIATKSCGVDLEGLGFWIEELSIPSVEEVVQRATHTDPQILEALALKAFNAVRTKYTFERYQASIEQVLKNLTGGTDAHSSV